VPRLWTDTIDAHRAAVRDATLDATAALVDEHGLASVTMSQIATRAGIGRATLYKYFPDVESILAAWHERQVASHLQQLEHVRDKEKRDPLAAVLHAYALISHERHGGPIAAALHRGEHVDHAASHLRQLIARLIAQGADEGRLRDDVDPDELAAFCLSALEAARGLPSKAAVGRLVDVTMTGLYPRPVV
jgi:AcrR family transcriptional regulator